MDRLLSERAVIEALQNRIGESITDCIKAIPPVPSAEPKYFPPCEDCHTKMDEIRKAYDKIQLAEPKTGHWKRISMDKYSEHSKYWYRCDRCGKDNLGNTDWCPHCGVKMVEPQEGEG